MAQKVVAILEARAGEHLAELVQKRGYAPLLAPALEEVPDVDLPAIAALLSSWQVNPFHIAIFQTGVGTRGLFQATDHLGLTGEFCALLRNSTVIVRGPKPVGELNARGVAITHRAASPFTTDTVLDCLSGSDLRGTRILLQRYGAANRELRGALEGRLASVDEISTYRWALPKDVRPLHDLLDALRHNRVDAALFTSAVQIQNLYTIAEQAGHANELTSWLNRCAIGSVGPVCSRALMAAGVRPTFEASPPKLGPLLAGLEKVMGINP